MHFIDEARIEVLGGRGGNGCAAFRREKFVPRGGPAGGDGGHGGSVILIGDTGLNTLYHLRHRQRYSASSGRHGEGSNKTGRSGADREILVPLGTVVEDDETGEVLIEILEEGERFVAAGGGRGGRGNARFASATRQAPEYAESGRDGELRRLHLELKLLADVGLVGLPNAGKSTLVSRVSAARPKVADYPFTTLTPHLGVVAVDGFDDPFVIADLPGLIAGAASGAGLGIQFLKHVERCRVLVHLVDLSAEGDVEEDFADVEEDFADVEEDFASVEEDFASIERELAEFDAGLLERSRLVVGSKVDAAISTRREGLRQVAERRRLDYFEVSSVTGEGVEALVRQLQQRLREGASQE